MAIATSHRTTQSRTAPRSGAEVTAEMLNEALAKAHANHKFLMIEFGADWCSDCLELSQRLKEPVVRDYLKEHFVIVNVDVGRFDLNVDIAKSLGVDVTQGIPAAVFYPPDSSVPSRKIGTNQILAYLDDVAERR